MLANFFYPIVSSLEVTGSASEAASDWSRNFTADS
jgi:hypothetical protein